MLRSASKFPWFWFHGHHMRHANPWETCNTLKGGKRNRSSHLTGNSCRQLIVKSALVVSTLYSSSTSSILSHLMLYTHQLKERTQVMRFQREGRGGRVLKCVFSGGVWLRLRGRSLLNWGTVRSNGSSVCAEGGCLVGAPPFHSHPSLQQGGGDVGRHQTAGTYTRGFVVAWANKQVVTGAQRRASLDCKEILFHLESRFKLTSQIQLEILYFKKRKRRNLNMSSSN